MKALSILCLLTLAACDTPPGPPINHVPLANKLDSLWPGHVPPVELSDTDFELVPFERVVRASLDAKRQYRAQVWDCDDEVASALHRLRVRHQHDHPLPPAVGRVRGVITEGDEPKVHDLIWCYDSTTGRIRLYDASYLFEPALTSLRPLRVSDF